MEGLVLTVTHLFFVFVLNLIKAFFIVLVIVFFKIFLLLASKYSSRKL